MSTCKPCVASHVFSLLLTVNIFEILEMNLMYIVHQCPYLNHLQFTVQQYRELQKEVILMLKDIRSAISPCFFRA